MHFNDREEILELTPLWKGERFPDGRPKVPDKHLDALEKMTLEEVWKPIFVLGYEHQFVGGGENPLKVLHDDDRKLIGRAVTCAYCPTRPDLHQLQFARYRIDGIHNIIILGKVKLTGSFREIEHLVHPHQAIRIDIQNPPTCRFYLGQTHGGMGGQNLAVDVGNAHRITVNEIQLPHTAAGQSLHRIAAHAAQTEHRHSCALQTGKGLLPQEQAHPGKFFPHISSRTPERPGTSP